MHHCNPTLPSIAPSNVPVIHGPPAHPVSSSPAFLTLCVVSSSPSPPPKVTFLVVAGVCLSIETFGRPVHLSVLALAFFLFSDTSSLIQSPVSAQDHNQNKNTLEQEITAVLVFQVVDLSEVASPSGCRNRSFSAGSHFSDDPSDSWNKKHYQIARPLNAIAFLPWTLRRSSGVSLASSRPTKRRI